MLLRRIAGKAVPTLSTRIYYPISRFDKFLHLIQSLLNKMANQDFRTFKQKAQQSEINNLPVHGTEPPKNALQAEKRFTDEQQSLSEFQKGRLKRIDDILGTKTHFHESRMFQQRLDSQHVLKISLLQAKYKQKDRTELDLINPNMLKFKKLKFRRKLIKGLTKLKVYPSGNKQLGLFEDDPHEDIKTDIRNKNLIKFLSEQALFTKLALGPLSLTMESIANQKLLVEEDGNLLDIQKIQNNFIFNGQVYFRPEHLMAIYRIDLNRYNKKLLVSIDKLQQAVLKNQGNIQQVISLDEIYECLKNYYHDQRVSEYLSKIENNELQYFLTNIQISPDNRSAFIVIDLLNNKKQYVGLYKQIQEHGNSKLGIRKQNVLFNFKPDVALRNNGELYYIQRSQEGLYTQFTKAKFSMHPHHSTQENQKREQEQQKTIQKINQDMITKFKNERDQQILFKCRPYQQLRIIGNSQAKFSTNEVHVMSTNILLQLTNVGEKTNNQIYLVLHKQGINRGQQKQINIQQITLNNSKLQQVLLRKEAKQKYKYIEEWQTNHKVLYSECHEIMDVGYLVVRYCLVGSDSADYLKYGHNQRYSKYATIVPYTKAKFNVDPPNNKLQLIQHKTNSLQKFKRNTQIETLKQNNQNKQVKQKTIQNFQIEMPSQESTALLNTRPYEQQPYELQHTKQQLIYVCPEQQYFSDLRVKHSSISNVYLLINNSVESVYDRNSLYFHPLRKSVQPYSLYLDGYPMKIVSQNIGSGQSGKVHLKLNAPLLPVGLEYTLWKKQIKEEARPKIYTETITIKEDEADQIIIKILSNSHYLSKKKGEKHENQPVILYLPSKNERIDDIQMLKLAQKGVMFIQIVKCRGIFGTNMIDFLRGAKQMHSNYIQDIYDTLVFIRQHISEHVGVYAEGPSSCFATLLLNIQQNSDNQLFDCSVLHEGLYDTDVPNQFGQYYFGSDPQVFKKINPFNFQIFDPTVSQHKFQPNQNDQAGPIIYNLSNILFTTLSKNSRAQSRKFVNKLRSHQKTIFQTVFLKQFDTPVQKDIFNLAFLYSTMKQKLNKQYNQVKAAEMKQKLEQGEAESRIQKDKEERKKRNRFDEYQ